MRVRWGCGAELVDRDEQAVDMAVLAENLPAEHHHHLHLPHLRH